MLRFKHRCCQCNRLSDLLLLLCHAVFRDSSISLSFIQCLCSFTRVSSWDSHTQYFLLTLYQSPLFSVVGWLFSIDFVSISRALLSRFRVIHFPDQGFWCMNRHLVANKFHRYSYCSLVFHWVDNSLPSLVRMNLHLLSIFCCD